MTKGGSTPPSPSVIDRLGLQALIEALRDRNYDVIAPRIIDDAVGLGTIEREDELPQGWRDRQDAGSYRLEQSAGGGLFDHSAPVHSWKRFLYPPVELLFRSRREDGNIVFEIGDKSGKHLAFLGVRACDLSALQVLDRVLADGRNADSGYAIRRKAAFIVAVDCARVGGTCFCASMGTGPAAGGGYDLKLSKLSADDAQRLLVEVGTERGGSVLDGIERRPAAAEEIESARRAIAEAAAAQTRSMVPDVAPLLRRNLEHQPGAASPNAVSLHHPEEYAIHQGRVISNRGLDIPVGDYLKHFQEEHVQRSTALRGLTTDGKPYLLGPLARYSNNYSQLTPLARKAADDIGLGAECSNPFKSILVRMVETVVACEEALRLAEAYVSSRRTASCRSRSVPAPVTAQPRRRAASATTPIVSMTTAAF